MYWDIRNGVIQLWRYGPIIWRNRDWDYTFLLKLMEAKFRHMAVECGDKGHHVGSEREGKQLRVCAELCRRIQEDDYICNLTGPVKYNSSFEDHPLGTRVTTEVLKDGAPINMRPYYEMAERNRKNDLAYLTTLMRKHLLTWWD